MDMFIVSFVTSTIFGDDDPADRTWLSGKTSTAAVALAFDAAVPGAVVSRRRQAVLLFGYTTLIGWASTVSSSSGNSRPGRGGAVQVDLSPC